MKLFRAAFDEIIAVVDFTSRGNLDHLIPGILSLGFGGMNLHIA